MANSAGQRNNVLVSSLFVIFGGPGILGLYIPAWITHWRVPPRPFYVYCFACLLILAGLVPLFESIARFIYEGSGTLSPSHPTEFLVSKGLYRYVRTPMYVGVLSLIAGQALLFRSWELWVYLALVAFGFHLFVVLYEEPTLRRKYGVQYEEFCRVVPRWFPRLRKPS